MMRTRYSRIRRLALDRNSIRDEAAARHLLSTAARREISIPRVLLWIVITKTCGRNVWKSAQCPRIIHREWCIGKLLRVGKRARRKGEERGTP